MELLDEEVEFIRQSREEIRDNRMKEIKIYGENIVECHPVTGEPVDEPYEKTVNAVVTRISVRTSVDRKYDEGIEIESGDIIVDISLKDIPEDIDLHSINKVKYDGQDFIAITTAKLGLSEDNRIELIGRRKT